ncbi:MAG: 30S ribosomal protein S6 [Anaerolineae bacterium]|nr:30S ribosomal protein S6 [Anaerolineae bacterium]
MAKQKKHNYELLFIIDPTLSEEDKENLLDRVKGYLEQADGEVFSFKSWGLRRLAYTIKNQNEGQYYLVQCAMTPEKVSDFRRSLTLAEGVLREMVIRVDEELTPEKPERSPKPEVISTSEDDDGASDNDTSDDEE